MQIDRCRFGKRKRGFMSKVIMMCGVCGSGKTTYAKKKEQEGYIRLSIDEEMWKLYGRKGIDYPEEEYEKLSEQVEAALQKKLLSMIQQGKDVVIDFSFWSKENRNFYKELIRKAGAETELVYMMAKTEHSHPLGMVVSTHFRCGKGVKRGLKNGALPFNID